MTKTFKLGAIFFIATLWLILMKLFVSFVSFSDNTTSWLFSFLVQVIGMGLIPILLYKQWIGTSITEGFHLKSKIHPMNYVIAILLGFLLYFVTMGVSLIYQNILVFLGYTHITTNPGTIYSGWEVLAMQIITVALLPGFFEEFIDRGLLMTVFKNEKNVTKIIIILAIIFAFAHQNITQTGYTAIGGLVIAYMAVKTRSIFPAVLIHTINNGLSVIVDYSTQKQNAIGMLYESYRTFMSQNIMVVMALWIAAGFLIAYLLKLVKKLNYERAIQEKEEKKRIDMSESIYKLFGESKDEDYKQHRKTKLWEYGMVIAAVVLSLSVTIFTFIWGVVR